MNYFLNRKEKSNKELIEQIILEKYNQYYRLAYSYVHNDADACDIMFRMGLSCCPIRLQNQ